MPSVTNQDYLSPEIPAATRRDLLVTGAAVGLAVAFSGSLRPLFGGSGNKPGVQPVAATSPLDTVSPTPTPRITAQAVEAPAVPVGYGGLVADRGAQLSLPEGFSYRVLAEAGVTELESGELTPGYMDGTGSFRAPRGRTVLVVNHEQGPDKKVTYPVPALDGLTYDSSTSGGTTTLVLDPDGNPERAYVSLAGTDTNCSGGVTPWGTWLSGEETEARAGAKNRTFDHGYVFEVDPLEPAANRNPQPIKALGRFPHEAAVVDPVRGHIYLTEDAEAPNGLMYRWRPPFLRRRLGPGALRKLGATDGTLHAMRAHNQFGLPVADLSVATTPGTSYRLQWVPVPDRDAVEVSTRKQFGYVHTDKKGRTEIGHGPTITRSHKLEGAWWGNGGVYLTSSFAKPEDDRSALAHGGQVWFLDPVRDTLTLVLHFAPTKDGGDGIDCPDAITVSPFGGVLIAQDSQGAQHLFGAGADGSTFPVARNERRFEDGYSEFTGPNFSPDRGTLFANVQQPGTVLAITGPWRNAP